MQPRACAILPDFPSPGDVHGKAQVLTEAQEISACLSRKPRTAAGTRKREKSQKRHVGHQVAGLGNADPNCDLLPTLGAGSLDDGRTELRFGWLKFLCPKNNAEMVGTDSARATASTTTTTWEIMLTNYRRATPLSPSLTRTPRSVGVARDEHFDVSMSHGMNKLG